MTQKIITSNLLLILLKTMRILEAIVENDGILWLNKKHQEEGSDHKSLLEITIK